MNFLLDTHVLLWAAGEPRKLSASTLALLADPANLIYFSVVNIWEVAIKRAKGRPDFTADPRALRSALLLHGYRELLVNSDHALEVASLPALHKDPFDRLLIAQARVENLILLTVDSMVLRYGGNMRQA